MLNLDSVYQKGKYWKGKKVQEVIDENVHMFKGHLNKYPDMYSFEVHEYVIDVLSTQKMDFGIKYKRPYSTIY